MYKNILSTGLLTREQRQAAIKEIIGFFLDEKDEEIGVIQAESLLDFFLESTGLAIYNNGIEACKKLTKSRFEELEVDIETTLKKFKAR